jgi:hypothetical protein
MAGNTGAEIDISVTKEKSKRNKQSSQRTLLNNPEQCFILHKLGLVTIFVGGG